MDITTILVHRAGKMSPTKVKDLLQFFQTQVNVLRYTYVKLSVHLYGKGITKAEKCKRIANI